MPEPMTVKRLRQVLGAFPPDAEIRIEAPFNAELSPGDVGEISGISWGTNDRDNVYLTTRRERQR